MLLLQFSSSNPVLLCAHRHSYYKILNRMCIEIEQTKNLVIDFSIKFVSSNLEQNTIKYLSETCS